MRRSVPAMGGLGGRAGAPAAPAPASFGLTTHTIVPLATARAGTGASAALLPRDIRGGSARSTAASPATTGAASGLSGRVADNSRDSGGAARRDAGSTRRDAPPPGPPALPPALSRQISDEGRRLLAAALSTGSDDASAAARTSSSGGVDGATSGTRTTAAPTPVSSRPAAAAGATGPAARGGAATSRAVPARPKGTMRTTARTQSRAAPGRGTAPSAGATASKRRPDPIGRRDARSGTINADSDSYSTPGVPLVCSLGGPILFSAPHGLRVWRGGKIVNEKYRMHKREKWSTEIALKLAAAVATRLQAGNSSDSSRAARAGHGGPAVGGGTSFIVWNMKTAVKADKTNLDPNYLIPAQFESSPWHRALRRWRRAMVARGAAPVLVDVHGKKDRSSNLDLDVGMDPMEELWEDKGQFLALKKAIVARFRAALKGTAVVRGMTFGVEAEPYLGGYWGDDTHTFSHQAVVCGVPALQLEIPKSMRRALMSDDSLVDRFAAAICDAYATVVAPQRLGLEGEGDEDDVVGVGAPGGAAASGAGADAPVSSGATAAAADAHSIGEVLSVSPAAFGGIVDDMLADIRVLDAQDTDKQI